MHTSVEQVIENTTSEQFQLFIIALFLAVTTSWIAWRRGYYHFPYHTTPMSSKLSFGVVLAGFGVFLGVVVVVVPIIASLWLGDEGLKRPIDAYTEAALNIGAILLTSLGMLGFLVSLSSRTRQAIWGEGAFQSKRKTWRDMGLGSVTWLICYPLVIATGHLIALIIILIGFPHVEYEQVAVKYLKLTQSYPILFIIMGLLIVFVVPVIEEVLFRGCLQTWLKQYLSRSQAIVTTSIIFALFHFSGAQGIDNIQLLASLFLLSCFLGFLYERQRSLWAPIGLHATFNAISVLMILGSE